MDTYHSEYQFKPRILDELYGSCIYVFSSQYALQPGAYNAVADVNIDKGTVPTHL